MRNSRMTSRTVRKACMEAALAAALAAAAGGALALDGGGIVRVAADNYPSAAPTNDAPGMPGRAEGDRDARPPATTSMNGEKAKEAVSDSAITTKVKTKLLTTKDLKSTGIHVKTRDGIVNVTGTVPSKEQHTRALETIRSVEGVSSVHDELKVSSR